MEEMILQFSHSLSSDNFQKNLHTDLYKFRGTHKSAQENRRVLMLNAQKEKRNSIVDSNRGLLELIKESDDHKPEATKNVYKPKVHVPGFTSKKRYYNDRLMLSEWMTECPKDFSTNWLALACPKGQRVLIVAAKGNTKAYSKHGYCLKTFQSHLPGGNHARGNFNKYCVLDGVWNAKRNSYYVLDVLVWGMQTMTECELGFRDYWIRTKLSEIPELRTVSSDNKYAIYLIEKYNCDAESLSNLFMTWPVYDDNIPEIDGFLFYHRDSFYTSGTTPLAIWLFPYMIHEILGMGIQVHTNYQAQKPDNYICQKDFIEEFEKKQEKKTTKTKQFQERRRTRSFSSVDCINSSFSSSDISEQSFCDGKVQMVFEGSISKPKAKESEDVLHKLGMNKKGKKMRSKMDIDKNDSIEVDSAVSSMDDSLHDMNSAMND